MNDQRAASSAAELAMAAVRREYARLAPYYDRVWRPYLDTSITRTLAYLDGLGSGRVLDVGCGTGLLLRALSAAEPGAELHGLDLTPQMLARARARLGERVALRLGQADRLPYDDDAFDAVLSTSVLHLLPDPPGAAVREWARVLRPGGTLVVTDWRADHGGTRAYLAALRLLGRGHVRPLSAGGLVAVIQSCGVRVDRYVTYGAQGWGLTTVQGVLTRP